MKPERAQELYSDYAEGALTPALKQALEQHFEADPAARADYAQFARVYSLLEVPLGQELEAPLGFRAKILEQVAANQSRRDAVSTGRAAGWFGGWLSLTGNRRAAGGVLAALAAVVVIGAVVLHPGKGSNQLGTFVPGLNAATPAASTLIQKVDMQTGTDSNYHLFHLHLPNTVTAATVNAYVITATEQITDPAHLSEATPALTQQHLSNRQGVQIPIAPAQAPPVGSTLNLLAQWTPDSSSEQAGSEVAFTPFGPADPATAAPVNAPFLDAVQAVAAHYGATVIVDARATPTQPVTADFSGSDPQAPLDALAKTVNYTVQKMPDGANTYFLAPSVK